MITKSFMTISGGPNVSRLTKKYKCLNEETIKMTSVSIYIHLDKQRTAERETRSSFLTVHAFWEQNRSDCQIYWPTVERMTLP